MNLKIKNIKIIIFIFILLNISQTYSLQNNDGLKDNVFTEQQFQKMLLNSSDIKCPKCNITLKNLPPTLNSDGKKLWCTECQVISCGDDLCIIDSKSENKKIFKKIALFSFVSFATYYIWKNKNKILNSFKKFLIN